ncbi:MAG: aldo/keto reductase [Sulfuritalea sp.]|nr:aldo/keto reductase [Sulfuritalea sp.]
MGIGTLIYGVGSIHRILLRRHRSSILRQALEMGFRNFDVAPSYGNGLNEVELGVALKETGTDCRVTTKFGIPSPLYGAAYPNLFFLVRGFYRLGLRTYAQEYRQRLFSKVEMVRSLEGSLMRLKRDYVDDFLIHEPLGLLGKNELLEIHDQAERMKVEGKIVRWGVAGPALSVAQFERDPLIEVFQLPLEDLGKLDLSQGCRKIVYGVFRAYKDRQRYQPMSFSEFVRGCLDAKGVDVIISSTSPTVLSSFKNCF